MSRRGEREGGRGRFVRCRGHCDQRNFNSSNNQNKRQELKIYPRVNGTDQQMVIFTKVKEYLILNI